jgi:DNA-binding transcriptional LysR family regulator
MSMDRLSAMQAFVAVVEAGSFVGAADALGISKTSVSRLIVDLESHLGTRLLQRTTRRVRTTEAGERFFARASLLLSDLEEAESEVTWRTLTPHGVLRVSVPLSFGPRYLAPLLPLYRNQYPDVELEVSSTDHLVDLVDDGFDLAIRGAWQHGETYVARHLAPLRIVICASPAYVATHGAPPTPDALAAHNCAWRSGCDALRPGRRQCAARARRRRPGPGRGRLMPPPPCAWMAQSITWHAMLGAATLIIAISLAAALLPTVSIICAALSTRKRAWSMSMRASAMRSRVTPCSATGGRRPRATGCACTSGPAPLGQADQAHAVVNAARSQAALGDLEAAALAQQDVGDRHAHILEHGFGMAMRRIVEAEHRHVAQHGHARRVARHDDHRLLLVAVGLSGSVLPMKMKTLQRGSLAPDDHHLRPLITYSSPSRSMRALDVGGVRRGDRRLGHREAGTDLTIQQRLPATASARSVP